MSTSSIPSGLPSSTAAALASVNTPIQISGLASGLNTSSIISELMSIAAQPVTNLTNQQNGLTALNTQLTNIQSSLRGVSLNARALADPGLWVGQQSVVSSNPALVTVGSSAGAGIGGHLVSVIGLAASASRTYTFTSPAAADTIQVGGAAIDLAAGATAQDFVSAVNANSAATGVTAALDRSGEVVLYSTATGSTAGVSVSDPGGSLSEQTGLAQAGQDAQFAIDGGATQTAPSNTVANAIPGITLTFAGITSTPVSISVQPPAASTSNIEAAVTAFVQSYNAAISQIQGQLTQKPVSGDPTQGTLFGDADLQGLLSNMRTANYTPGAGLPARMASLADIGISTGAAVGSGTVSQSALSGQLTIDKSKLEAAIAANPNGVRQILTTWSAGFSAVVDAEASASGAIDARIQGDNSEIASLGDQIANQNEMLQLKQKSLTARFAALEAAISQAQSQGSWLAEQTASITANSTAIASRA